MKMRSLLLASGAVAIHAAALAQAPLHQTSLAQCPLGGTQTQAWLLEQATDAMAVLGRPLAPLMGREVNWAEERVLVAATGQKPSLGYRLALVDKAPKAAKPPGRGLHYQSTLEAPPPGTAAATALSRPCVLAVLPRAAGKARPGTVSVQLEGKSWVAHVPSPARRPVPPPPAPMAL